MALKFFKVGVEINYLIESVDRFQWPRSREAAKLGTLARAILDQG